MKAHESLAGMLAALPEIHGQHAHTSHIYRLLDAYAQFAIGETNLRDSEHGKVELQPFGTIVFPYYKMGAIDTVNLFGLDELIIFSFYEANRNRYKRAADLGANLGLHSIIMARCGWHVTAYEPDPAHHELLLRNLALNGITTVKPMKAAVAEKNGTAMFVRVLGNTTSSHLAGAKDNPYGELERFEVATIAADDVFRDIDFIKMDVEGSEGIIIKMTNAGHWAKTDMMLEVGSEANGRIIFEHLQTIGVHCYAQKINWARVQKIDDMPKSYKEGSLFISSKPEMPW